MNFLTMVSNPEKGQSNLEKTNVLGIKKGAICPLLKI